MLNFRMVVLETGHVKARLDSMEFYDIYRQSGGSCDVLIIPKLYSIAVIYFFAAGNETNAQTCECVL